MCHATAVVVGHLDARRFPVDMRALQYKARRGSVLPVLRKFQAKGMDVTLAYSLYLSPDCPTDRFHAPLYDGTILYVFPLVVLISAPQPTNELSLTGRPLFPCTGANFLFSKFKNSTRMKT